MAASCARPGFFSAFAGLVPLARRGVLLDLGDGLARTNPIDERDLADVLIDAALHDGPRELVAGGPDVMTRAQLFELVAAMCGATGADRAGAAWLGRIGSLALRPFHPADRPVRRFRVRARRLRSCRTAYAGPVAWPTICARTAVQSRHGAPARRPRRSRSRGGAAAGRHRGDDARRSRRRRPAGRERARHAHDGDRVEVAFLDGKRATYLRVEVAPRKLGVARYAQRRAAAWDAAARRAS